jgi:PPM family protein phosphatase
MIWAAAASDVGLVRSRNEDGVWLHGTFVRDGHEATSVDSAAIIQGVFLAVADGVGGAAAGDVASKFVLEQMAAFVGEPPEGVTDESIGPWMRENAEIVNRRLVVRGLHSDELSGMATTLTGLYFRGSIACWINAGDSRLYSHRAGHLNQISRDHTLRELLGDPNIPGNIISNCFGTQDEFYLDVGLLSADDRATGDLIYLLCSDGLSDYATGEDMESILTDCAAAATIEALETGALRLVEAAKSGGGGDNVTCVIVWPRRM